MIGAVLYCRYMDDQRTDRKVWWVVIRAFRLVVLMLAGALVGSVLGIGPGNRVDVAEDRLVLTVTGALIGLVIEALIRPANRS